MSKKIYIGENDLIKIKRFMAGKKTGHKPFIAENEPPYEKDEFEIGGEGGNNDYFHINENRLSYVDLSDVGAVNYEWYFDEDEYKEWLEDSELEDSEETRNKYYTEEVTYGVEYVDNDTFHYMESDQNLLYDDLVDLFGEKMAEQMLSNCIENGSGSFETYELYTDNTYDLTNPNEVNDIAMKLFSHGEYYKDCRGFILSNGVVVYTPSEHNEICMIPGVNSKFDFIEMGNIRVLPNSIDIGAEPTRDQEEVLRKVISSYPNEEFYMDIFDKGSEIGVKYFNPNWRYVMGEIDRYYSEGIRPQGSDFYESKEGKKVINEYSSDLRLPFEEPEYANKFYIEQYKDWLEDYGKYGSLPSGTLEFWDEIKQAVVEIKAKQLHGRFDGSIPEDKNADEIFYDLQTRLIGPYIKFTNDGKVYVERAISINKRPRGYDNDQRTDFYKQLWKDYNDNVGGCWSYRKDGAQAYCGDDYGYSIILRGYIRTDDIDFIKTVQLNYHYSNEHEIRVKPFAKVELFNFSYGDDTINFNKGLIVSSTYSGNNSKFVGNVGKIDDGFGGITYINRQNKILNGEEEYNNELNKYVDERLSKGEDIYDVFDYVGAFKNGFAIVELFERCNFFNEANGLISEKWYDDCNDFENGFARVKLDNKWTFIREDGERINNEWYDDCYYFENGFAKVKLGDKWTFIREDGERINNEWYDYCYDFHNGFVIVQIDNKKTFIRQDGKRINSELYDGCDNFKNGFAKVKLGEKWTFIKEDGSHVNNEWYDGCNIFKNGFAIVKLGDECTFIREDGQHINNEWYDYCSDFINGFARVNLGEKWTFIREDGQHINNEWYDWCYNFENGFAKVKISDKWYKIDASGRRFTAEGVNKNNKKLIVNENQLIALKENIESEVESNEVNLSSFKKNDSLAKRIWDGMDLNPRVRLKLLDIADDFWDFTDINWVKPKGIHLTGSICNFNWSDESDIDLHLVVDFSEVDDRKDFVQEYFNSKKNEWNEEHSNLKIFGYPVELYVEDVNAETVSSGIYDLEENKWISEPSKDEIEEIGLDKYEIKSLAAKLMTKIDDLYDEFSATDDDAKLRSIGKRADKLLSSIKQMRKDGLSRGGESDPFNVIYKVLRRTDYLENLFNLKSELYDKLNSIDIEESVIKYYYNKIYPLNEEVVADGSAEHNPFKKRWKYEREALKSYLCNNGELMTSKENGKQYKVIFDTMLSQRLGLNYCICIQWNPITMKPGNIIYVRAYDKFTKKIFTPQFDTRGYDNIQGTDDDVKL